MNKLKDTWEGVDDVEIQKIGEGETGLTYNQALTARRLEAIAEWFAIPEEKREPNSILGLARALGISPASVRKWQHDPRMVRRVQAKTREYLTYLMPNVVWQLYGKVMEYGDVAAAKALLTAHGEDMRSRGVNITNTVNVGQVQQEYDDDRFLEEVDRVVERRARAKLAVVSGTEVQVSGNQGKETMAALYSDTSDSPVPSVGSPDKSSGGS